MVSSRPFSHELDPRKRTVNASYTDCEMLHSTFPCYTAYPDRSGNEKLKPIIHLERAKSRRRTCEEYFQAVILILSSGTRTDDQPKELVKQELLGSYCVMIDKHPAPNSTGSASSSPQVDGVYRRGSPSWSCRSVCQKNIGFTENRNEPSSQQGTSL
jgi:hypothetical protein